MSQISLLVFSRWKRKENRWEDVREATEELAEEEAQSQSQAQAQAQAQSKCGDMLERTLGKLLPE